MTGAHSDAALDLPYLWTPREYQLPAWHALHEGYLRTYLVWHRRAGKGACMVNFCVTQAAQRVGLYWHVLPTYKQGRKIIWDGMTKEGRKFTDYFPPELVLRRTEAEMSVWMTNGSLYQVVGADDVDKLVGANPIGVVLDEYALMDSSVWNFFRPILAENGGWAVFTTTPRGRNHAYELWQRAKKNKNWFTQLLTVDDTGAVTPEAIQEDRDSGMPEELVQQEYWCLPPGVPILTDRGQVPIEQVRTGMRVLTHSGRWRSVLETMEHETTGGLVEIQTYGNRRTLLVTPEHPVRTLQPDSQVYAWRPAGEIKRGDWLTMPRPRKGRPIVPPHLAKLAAWYVAEGSCSKTAVQFSLGSTEGDYADEIEACALLYGASSARATSDLNCLTVQVRSAALSDSLANACGSGAASKHLPWEWVAGHEALFLDRLIRGDGCEINGGWMYTTISESLAYDVQMLASACGYGSGISERRGGHAVIQGRNIVSRDSFCVRISTTPSSKILPAKNAIGVRVRSVARLPYAGRVHNLRVQYEESFVAAGRVVHNCSWDAPLVGSYYGDQVNAATKAGRITKVPWEPTALVETAWDLGVGDATAILFCQQIGKEVRIIDYYASFGKGLDHYAKVLQEKPYAYKHALLPHDAEQRSMESGKTRVAILQSLGMRCRVLPRMPIEDGIAAVRMLWPRLWIDEEKCEVFIRAAREYRKEFDVKSETYGDHPRHDWTSNPMDALRYLALGLRPAQPKRESLAPRLAIV